MRLLQRLALCGALLAAPLPAAAATLAFVGAAVIDGTGAAPIPDGVVLVTDGKVAAVGPRSAIRIPAGAQRIDVSGKTVMPGLVNAHAHVEVDAKSARPPADQLSDQLALYARYGVTTVFSLGDDGAHSVRVRDAVRADPQPSVARLYVAGPVLTAQSPEEARTAVTRNVGQGVDIIKTRVQGPATAPIRTPAVMGALVSQAHAADRRVAAHIFTAEEAKGVVDAGADIIAHSIRDRDVDPAFIAVLKARDIGYIPTLTRDLSVFVYETTPDFVADPFFAREAAYRPALAPLLAPEAQARVRGNAEAQSIKTALAQAKRNLKRLSDAGAPIAMGTDTGAPTGRWQGYFEHLELQMMVEAGLTPMQALVAASGGAARVMRVDDIVGTLQPGRHADLLVLGADPTADIRNTRTLEQVWIAGRRVN